MGELLELVVDQDGRYMILFPSIFQLECKCEASNFPHRPIGIRGHPQRMEGAGSHAGKHGQGEA